MDLIPAGKYRARCLEAALGETKTGKEQITGTFEIQDAGMEGQTVAWFAVFQSPGGPGGKVTPPMAEKINARILQSLRYCGWQGNDLTDLSGISDCDVTIEVEHHEWNGRVNARVKWVNRLGGANLSTPLDPDRARSFAARMRALAAATKNEPPTQGPTQYQPTPPAILEDLPF